MSYTKNLFKTIGLLRKFNFADIPQKTDALSNILSKAYSGGNFIKDDVNVISGISTYGTDQVAFYRQREYDRLAEIEIKNNEKIQVNNQYPNAEPMQTIHNQLEKIKIDLGEGLITGGGDGLLIEYYNWPKIYGDADDIISLSGGSYVDGQTSSIPAGEVRGSYFSPNTAVAPSDSESFFEFNQADLASKQIAASEIGFNNGFFNFGTGPAHPSIINDVGDSCIVKLSGYYNPGFQTYGKAGTSNTGMIVKATDRILIVCKSLEESFDGTSSSLPVIIKMWDVDQNTGFRIKSDSSPSAIFHYAPGVNSPVPNIHIGDGLNSPVYRFGIIGGRGINDTLFSPDSSSRIVNTNMTYVGHAVEVAPISDGSPQAFRKFAATAGGPSYEIKRNRFANPFKQNNFYAIEAYFVLPPRVANKIDNRSVFFQGYHHYHGRPAVLRSNYFYSENPLQKRKGRLNNILSQSIRSYGTKISGKVTRANNSQGIVNFQNHTESMGGTDADKYGRLLTTSNLVLDYRPPQKWQQINRIKWKPGNFGIQVNSPHQFHYVAFRMSKEQGGTGNSIPALPGNLLIDVDSPKPRVRPDCPGSVLDSFTYLDHIVFHEQEDYVYLSKPATGIKTKLKETTLQAIDHRGLKGYGTGIVKLIDGMGVGGEKGLQLQCGQGNPTGKNPVSRLFYDGEALRKNDIIIFDDYSDSPFLQVFDTSPGGSFLYRIGSLGTKPGRDDVLRKNSDLLSDATLSNKPYRMRPFDNTPEGRNFFVYHHRGLVDESLDGFCSYEKTGTPAIQALVKQEAELGATNVIIDRNTIESYDGKLYRNPWLPFSTDNTGGIFGMAGDYNGTSNPSGTIINKVVDLQLPFEITISGVTSETQFNGVYHLDQLPKIYNDPDASPNLNNIIGNATYGAPQSGDQYWKKAGDSPKRIHWSRSGGYWRLSDNSATANLTGGSFNSTSGKFIAPTSGSNIGGEGSLVYVSKNSPQAGLRIALIDSTTNAPQPVIQTLKKGFGITICDSPGRAKFRYQCFPPTDTAPPFRATATGLRTLPAGENGDGSDGIGSVIVSYASPNIHLGNTPSNVASITFSQLKIEGSYGDNSPGDSQLGTLTDSDLHTAGSYFQPGGVILLDSGCEDYDSLIDFEFITEAGDKSKYQIIASTDPTKSVPI